MAEGLNYQACVGGCGGSMWNDETWTETDERQLAAWNTRAASRIEVTEREAFELIEVWT
jgi:hypothetical protein